MPFAFPPEGAFRLICAMTCVPVDVLAVVVALAELVGVVVLDLPTAECLGDPPPERISTSTRAMIATAPRPPSSSAPPRREAGRSPPGELAAAIGAEEPAAAIGAEEPSAAIVAGTDG